MGCNCKKERKSPITGGEEEIKTSESVISYMLKSVVFLLFIIFLPIINIVIILVIFRMLVLNKELDVKTPLLFILKQFSTDKDDEDDEYYELTDEDVEVVNVEDIIEK